jgi:hypothetical protein
MRGALREELLARFPWLFDLGFRITEHDYSYKAMGSSFAVLESDSFLMRFTNDRGSISVEVAALSEPERWMDLGVLWQSLTGDTPSPQLDGWAGFVRDHAAQLAEALGPGLEKTRLAFDKRQREREEIQTRYRSELRQNARARRYRKFLKGPMGWIAAACLLIWVLLR